MLTDALAAGGDEAKRAFEAMLPMTKIDVGGANETMKDYGESADEDVPDPFVVQRFAERDEVFELRRA